LVVMMEFVNGVGMTSHIPYIMENIYIWVWVKIRYPNNWMVNTKLD
jgi:hypothetical protein